MSTSSAWTEGCGQPRDRGGARVARVQTNGYLVDMDLALRRHRRGRHHAAQVWLSSRLDADQAVKRLEKAGFTVRAVHKAASVAADYRHQGPGVAAVLCLAAAIAAGLVTVAAVAVNLASSARRRARELAPLLQVGRSRRALAGLIFYEQALLVVPGVIVGVAIGIVTERLVLPRLEEFAVRPAVSTLHFGVQPLLGLGLVLASAVVLAPVLFVIATRAMRAAERAAGTMAGG